MYDFLIIGGGAIGCALARELSRRGASVVVAERENDVCAEERHVTALICAARAFGKNAPVLAAYAATGEKMFRAYSAALGIPYRKTGCVAKCDDGRAERMIADCRRYGVRYEERKGAFGERELFFPDAGVADGCAAVYAMRENAATCGAAFEFGFAVTGVESRADGVTVHSSDGRELTARYAVNCAGSGGGRVARASGDLIYLRHAAEDIVVSRGAEADFPFFTDDAVVLPMRGACVVAAEGEDTARNAPVVRDCSKRAAELLELSGLSGSDMRPNAVTRTYSEGGDIIVRQGPTKCVTHILGAGSAGLTVAPAIAVAFASSYPLGAPKQTIPAQSHVRVRTLSVAERNALARRRGDYAEIVCASPFITYGEIADAVKSGAKDLRGIERRLLDEGESGGAAFAEAAYRALGGAK